MRRLPIPISLALLATPLSAQFLNRAVWLGNESEDVRRAYVQDTEYFLDRASYVLIGPWHTPTLDPFGDRIRIAAGSVSTDRLTIEALANVGVELGDGFLARLAYLQSEHQSAQFQRFGVGLEKRLSDATALTLLLEGTPDKSRSDFTFGAELFRSDHGAHRVSFTLVDAASKKSDDFAYDSSPYGLMFAGFAGDQESLQVGYELAFQLPFEERELSSGDVFRMFRAIGSLEARWRFAERDRLILALDGELAAKDLRTADGTATDREELDTGLLQARLEWWRRGDDDRELSVGALLTRLRNDGVRPNAPDQDLAERRDEAMLLARGRLRIGGAWSVEPYVIAGHVRFDPGLRAADARRFDGFQGKVGVPFAYAFSDRAFIRFDLSMQIDEALFGGGGVQLQATF